MVVSLSRALDEFRCGGAWLHDFETWPVNNGVTAESIHQQPVGV